MSVEIVTRFRCLNMRADRSGSTKSEATARLLEETARLVYTERGPRAFHPGQWAVLRFLASAAKPERTIGGVALSLGITHAPASRAVASLVRKKLVTISIAEQDRRVRYLDLTPVGQTLLEEDPMGRLAFAIDTLDSRSRSEFAKTLEAVSALLKKARQ